MEFLIKKLKPKWRFAIVSASPNIMVRNAEAGIIEQLVDNPEVDFDSISIGRDNTFQPLTQRLDNLLSYYEIDLIFTIGRLASQVAKTVTEFRGNIIPITFGGVYKPIEYGLVQSMKNSGNHLIGVSGDKRDYAKQLRFLFKIVRPGTFRKVKVIYCAETLAEGVNDFDVQFYRRIQSELSIKVEMYPVKIFEDITAVAGSIAEEGSLLMLLRDGYLMYEFKELLPLCRARKFPLITSDLGSVRKGAALGIGDDDWLMGAKMADKAFEYLKQGRCIKVADVHKLAWTQKARINISEMGFQGLPINFEGRFMDHLRKRNLIDFCT